MTTTNSNSGSILLGVGTAAPESSYSQSALLDLLGYKEHRLARRLFGSHHIEKRHLFLPPPSLETGQLPQESQRDLLDKFRMGATTIGSLAIRRALGNAGLEPSDIDAITCVTSTGFSVPGLSCLFCRELGLSPTTWRIDIVGMGCNAGLNGLAALDSWLIRHPRRRGLLVCCEVNSAIYCAESSPREWLVNSLFGDGAAAVAMGGTQHAEGAILGRFRDFESHVLLEHSDSMRFDWHPEGACWRFHVGREVPRLLGENIHLPVDRLLGRHGLHRTDIDHWVLHSGGGSVVDAIKAALNLSENHVRHTRSVLRDFGNLSSASFLFTLQRLLQASPPKAGQLGVMITMGPGAQIETALLGF